MLNPHPLPLEKVETQAEKFLKSLTLTLTLTLTPACTQALALAKSPEPELMFEGQEKGTFWEDLGGRECHHTQQKNPAGVGPSSVDRMVRRLLTELCHVPRQGPLLH